MNFGGEFLGHLLEKEDRMLEYSHFDCVLPFIPSWAQI